MNNWRDLILDEFSPGVARLTIVADPDGLLLEEGILEGIGKRGFYLIPCEDNISFRFAFESKFRSHWDLGESTDLMVVLRSEKNKINALPFDLLQAGRKLIFNLGDIFPDLSYTVISKLDRIYFDSLYNAQIQYPPGSLGENATKDYILLHVFEATSDRIKSASELLRILLRRHYRGESVPTIVENRFIQLLRQNDTFNAWPLETIVPNREAFFAFLQEHWPIYLDRMIEKKKEEDGKSDDSISKKVVDLPFGHDDVRIYIENLFIEGLLQPVPHSDELAETWMSIGIQIDSNEKSRDRMIKLIENVNSQVPTIDARYGVWLNFAKVWAELIHQYYKNDITIREGIEIPKEHVDASFTPWLMKKYSGLINLPPVPPVMLHHINRFLAHQIDRNNTKKVALIVIDGLSLDQWITIREDLFSRQPDLHFLESTIFAWVPTLTSVSRQAIFAGTPPLFFPSSIDRTDREPALWTKFWVDQGISKNEIVFLKNLGSGNIDDIKEPLSFRSTKVAGLVIDMVDKIMHGMELGTAGMHNQLRQWTKNNYLSDLVNFLLDRGFHVYLTSDHGNIQALGIGRPAEGAVADLRGERVRIYMDNNLRKSVKERFQSAHEWKQVGLPDSYFPLIAPERKAFVPEGEQIVCHGGISLEELVVPFIKIEREEYEQ